MRLIKRKIEKALAITIGNSSIHGRGVFAVQAFKTGDIIEQAPLILLESTERDILKNTILFDYYFLLNHPKTPVALALGMASLYNHAIHPNSSYTTLVEKEILIIKAIASIQPGDEVTINYNGIAGDESPVYFRNQENEQTVIPY